MVKTKLTGEKELKRWAFRRIKEIESASKRNSEGLENPYH